jgi:hypothetical protein
MKKENAWFLVMFAVEFLIILIPLELATHSEFVTRTKFIVAIVGILAIMFTDFWVLWNKISQVTKETRKKNKVYRNFQFMRKRKTGIEKRMEQMGR